METYCTLHGVHDSTEVRLVATVKLLQTECKDLASRFDSGAEIYKRTCVEDQRWERARLT